MLPCMQDLVFGFRYKKYAVHLKEALKCATVQFFSWGKEVIHVQYVNQCLSLYQKKKQTLESHLYSQHNQGQQFHGEKEIKKEFKQYFNG